MSKLFKSLAIFAAAVVQPSGSALSEVVNCDGVWTNAPCSGPVSKDFSVSTSAPASESDRELAQRKLWLHDLDMLRLKAKREYGLQTSIAHVQTACLNSQTSSAECSALVAERETEIQRLMIARQQAAAEEQQAEKKGDSPAQQVVVIREPRDDGYFIGHPPHYKPGHPIIRDKPHHRHYGEQRTSSAGVSATFSSAEGGTNIEVSAGAAARERSGSREVSSGALRNVPSVRTR